MRKHLATAQCVFAAVVAAAAGDGVAATPVRAPEVQAVIDCRTIEAPTPQLACYNAAVARMDAATRTGDLVTLDRQQALTVRRQAFGFTLPSLSLFDAGERPGAMDRIDETLAGARQDAQGKWTFVMQDGAVWRQIDTAEILREPHRGASIVIERGVLGSYLLSIDNQANVRVHRDD